MLFVGGDGRVVFLLVADQCFDVLFFVFCVLCVLCVLCVQVRVACFAALEQIGVLFDGVSGFSSIVNNNCNQGLRGKTIDNYEQFIIGLAKLINASYPKRK